MDNVFHLTKLEANIRIEQAGVARNAKAGINV
jgi:hypothetical protein